MTADEQQRQAVWVALADLYLDTELEQADFARIASVCRASGLSWPEIQRINYQEVAPALLANLQSAAGEWAGWNEAWVLQRIGSHLSLRPRRYLGSRRLWCWQVNFYTGRAMRQIKQLIPS